MLKKIDYLTDNLNQPRIMLFNIKITNERLIPELIYLASGFVIDDQDLYDRENKLVCKVKIPFTPVGGVTPTPNILLKENIEFKILKVYE